MESSIHIGGRIDRQSAENLGDFVEKVFKSGKENGMDQSTIVTALGLISTVINPNNVTVTNCSFVGTSKVAELGN